MKKTAISKLRVLSATPTPLTKSFKIDFKSLKKTIRHHIGLGVQGLFIAGSCGEGPCLPRTDFRRLTSKTCEINNGKMTICAQVTDNSYGRVLENIKTAKADGADIAVVAEPWFSMPISSRGDLENYYFHTVDKSPLPVGIYCRKNILPIQTYRKLFMHPNVKMIKDSSLDMDILKLVALIQKKRKDMVTLTGNEFEIPLYLRAGYRGVLAGGGILIGALLAKAIEAADKGDFESVDKLQKHCARILHPAYGGKTRKSWLNGLKYTLVRMGIFETTACYLDLPFLRSDMKNINKMIKCETKTLFPYYK